MFTARPGPATAGHISCGDTLGPGIYWLHEDITGCTGAWAIKPTGPAILNLNDFTVSCDSETTEGIILEGSRAYLTDGNVEDCATGVRLEGSGRHNVTDITARNNADDGVLVVSNRNYLADNDAEENGDFGFHVKGDSNRMSENHASGQTGSAGSGDSAGFLLSGGDRNTLLRNNATANEEGFVLEEGSDGNALRFNIGREQLSDVFKGDNNELVGNLAVGGPAGDGDGFVIEENASGNLLKFNVATLHNDCGISIEAGGEGNTVRFNRAFDNNQNYNGKDEINSDLKDDNPECGTNTWSYNSFDTKQVAEFSGSQACIGYGVEGAFDCSRGEF